MKKISYSIHFKIITFISIGCILCISMLYADIGYEPFMGSETKCWAKGAELLDSGDIDEALKFLKNAVTEFNESEIIFSLYGEALFRSHKLSEAERQFRKVLDMNPYNDQAKQRIEDIRNTEKLLESREIANLKAFGKDVTSKILMVVVGVWFGSLLTLLSEKIFNYFKRSNLQKALDKKHYNMVMDILEEQVAGNHKRELTTSISKLIKHFSQNQPVAEPVKAMDKFVLCVKAFMNDKSNAELIINQARRVMIRDYVNYLDDWINKKHYKGRVQNVLMKMYHMIYFVISAYCDGQIQAVEFCILQSMSVKFKFDAITDETHLILSDNLKIQNYNEKTIRQHKYDLIQIIQNSVTDPEDQIQLMNSVLFTISIDGKISRQELSIIDELAGDWKIDQWKNNVKKSLEESGNLVVDIQDLGDYSRKNLRLTS